MKYGIEESCWKSIFGVFSNIPNIEKAILFGSRAKGAYKSFSDIDIALVGDALCLDDLVKVKNNVDDLLLPYEFDFCIYKNLKSSELKSHIDRRGVELYCKSGM